MKTLSIQRPLPSIEMWIPASVSPSVKATTRELAALVGIERSPEEPVAVERLVQGFDTEAAQSSVFDKPPGLRPSGSPNP